MAKKSEKKLDYFCTLLFRHREDALAGRYCNPFSRNVLQIIIAKPLSNMGKLTTLLSRTIKKTSSNYGGPPRQKW